MEGCDCCCRLLWLPIQGSSRFCHYLFFVLVLLEYQRLTHSLPHFLLTSHAAKCMQVEVTRGSTVRIEYNCPDLVLPESQQKADEDPKEETDNTESRFNERYRQKLEELKKMSRNMRDINIMVMQREEIPGAAWRRRPVGANSAGSTGRLRQQLDSPTGTMEFFTGESDGHVEVCVQSLAARTLGASRVTLNITVERTDTYTEEERAAREADMKRLAQELAKNRTEVVQSSSRITGELQRLEQRIKEIESNAQYAKDKEVDFHQKTVRLNRAVRYWPMFRMAVLVVAGYFQVTYIINYMKSKHIY